ncbi:MBL fold metallo-hydrolase [Photobacterium damselae subsp. damselae]|uniref:MBL fold metallo-hydrolase n=1 Tax=Photobacterium damselae TaxID=38293 RepID=UPI00083A081E|nr:MBL fold metallo-hydrolase [Photobacterium damselae]QSH56385.1 MBL fold metallo-hydrolase [Photobacterium damselae subsp. damselae]
MKITLNYAGNGDCILIESMNAAILVDGGTANSFTKWKDKIESLDKLDCVIVTHIDSDHVNGIIKLIDSKSQKKPIIERVLYNGAEQILGYEYLDIDLPDDYLLDSLSARVSDIALDEINIGTSEGTSLSFILNSRSINTNSLAIHNDLDNDIKIGDLSIKMIGPTQDSLMKLKEHWLATLNDDGITRKIVNKSHAAAFESYINSLEDSFSVEVSNEEVNSIDALADFDYSSDTSLANETSLAFLVVENDKSVLMLGDSHAETVIDWLNKNGIEKLKVDAVKISHHGSKNNINRELMSRFECDTYLISTNGKIFKHPDFETLAVIAKYSSCENCRIFVNNNIEHIKNDFTSRLKEYNNTELSFNIQEVEI